MEKYVKVLRQDWRMTEGGNITSLSKDKAQLDQTIADIKPGGPMGKKESAVPQGGSDEIRIPKESEFAHMVQQETVFLHDDEMDIIYDSPDSK